MSKELADKSLWGGLHNPCLTAEEADMVIVGLPFDGAASFRRGAAQAPDRIRSISYHIPPTTEQGELLTSMKLLDLGNIEPGQGTQEDYFNQVEATAAGLLGKTMPFFIGGDHSVTIPLLRAASKVFEEPIGIIHLDAHLDLCNVLGNNPLSHGCTIRRSLELANFDLDNIYFLGTRSYEVQEVEFLQDKQANIYSAGEIFRRGVTGIAKEVGEKLGKVKHVYLTLDIDVIEPGLAPGTGTPKAGGISPREVLELMKIFAELPIIGMDIVEVAPPLDQADVTSFVAQRVLTEMWGNILRKKTGSGREKT